MNLPDVLRGETVTLGRWKKPTLQGDIVTLRPMVVTDADAMWEATNDPEGRQLTHTTATFTPAQIRDWCASRGEQDERLDLTVVENSTGEIAGEAVLNEYDPEHDSANFRISLRGPAWYGRGLGTEATRLIVDHSLHSIGLRRITPSVLAHNPRAQRAYEKAGFRVTGVEHDDDGEDWVLMAIDRDS
jgi:RimJ/RimL family protein N-acetyltransferase